MRNAFTMLELVFVIVVAGILAVTAIPRFERQNLYEAAHQVVSHIRYTQHLAMMDDKFDSTDSQWFKDRWQIHFANTAGSDNKWSYIVFSDNFNKDGNANVSDQIAVNPINPNQYMNGGYSTGTLAYGNAKVMNELNLGHEYGIEDVDFAQGCEIGNDKQRLFFDTIGRPFYGGPHLQTAPYHDETNVKILKSTCHIELCSKGCTTASASEKVTIVIEPETGYVHIL